MEQDIKNTENNSEDDSQYPEGIRKRMKNLKRWMPGESGNPSGRPAGSRNYSTLYKEAMEKLAETNDITAEDMETMMITTNIIQAMQGNFKQFKDLMDRLHGKPKVSIDHTTGGKRINSNVVQFVDYSGKDDNDDE